MKNNKYYTPEISEFYVGFEYEWNNPNEDDIFRVAVADHEDVYHAVAEISNSYGNNYRVKYLDKEDIESFIHENKPDFHTQFKLRDTYDIESVFQTYWIEEKEFLDEEYIYFNQITLDTKITHKSKNLFVGTIKNKSEMQQLMKQLNII